MLRSIRLKNFRSLRDTGEVELRPIVLLVGANSSGKSSFLRFFPLLKQTVNANSHSPLLWYLDNADVDFGDFRNALFRGADEPWIEVSSQEAETATTGFSPEGFETATTPTKFSARITSGADGRSFVQRLSVSTLGDTIQVDTPDGSSLSSLTLNERALTTPPGCGVRRGAGPIARVERGLTTALATDLLTKKIWEQVHGSTSDEKLVHIADGIRHGDAEAVLGSMAAIRGGVKKWRDNIAAMTEHSPYVREIKELTFLRQYEQITAHLDEALQEFARGVRYLGPFRRPPQRFYRRTELAIDQIDRDGSNLAMFLDSLSSRDREAFSDWLGGHFGFGVHTEHQDAHVSLMIDTNSRGSFNLMDMGFGMSQMLPVVAQCWLSSGQLRSDQLSLFRNPERSILPGSAPTLIAVEQPELHLHPQHQAHLANMFSSTVEATRSIGQPICLCIETHSEAMIYRFGELVESGELRREDISILYFEKHSDKDETTVRPIEFGADGVLQNWPIGFFRG